MKKALFSVITLFTVIACVAIIACSKEEDSSATDLTPVMKQYAFMGELTSTTCGICGGSGYNNFNLAKKNNSGKIIALAFHCNYPSDSMGNSSVLYSYENSRDGGSGIPQFFIGDNFISYNSLQLSIDSILKKAPEAQVKFVANRSGNVINVASRIKFFKNVTGEYFITFFACENNINGGATAPTGYKQSGGVSDYKHNNVVRTAQTPSNAYGEKFSTATSFKINQTIDYSCKITLNPKWNYNNVYVTAVIWKKNPDPNADCQYMFVNGWDTQTYK